MSEPEPTSPTERGRYDMVTEHLTTRLQASAVALFVVQGTNGSGISISMAVPPELRPAMKKFLVQMMRDVANEMERGQ